MLDTTADNPVTYVGSEIMLAKYLAEMKADIIRWWGDGGEAYFETRMSNGDDIIGYAEKKFLTGFVYIFNGRVIGVAQVDDTGSSVLIENIITHPAYEGCGGAIIEAIARFSKKQCEYGGAISLYAASGDAAAAYLKMGFTYTKSGQTEGPGNMKLSPSRSAHWSNGEQGFTLSKYEGKTYAVGVA